MTAGENRKFHRNLREQPTARSLAFVGLHLAMAFAPIAAVLLIVFALVGFNQLHAASGVLLAGAPVVVPMMGNIKALRQRSADIKKEANAIFEASGGKLSEEQRTKLDGLKAELATVTGDIERAEAFLELERGSAGTAVEYGAAARAAAPGEAKKPFASLGEQLIAIAAAERSGGRMTDPRLMEINAAASGMGEAIPADGGFAVQHDFASGIITRVHDMGNVINRVRRTPVQGNGLKINAVDETSRANGSRWGGVQAYWAAEADTVTAKKPKLRQIDLSLRKLFGLYYATDELLQDAPALASIAQEAFAEELTFMAEDSIFNGTGAGQPLGILNSGCVVTVSKEGSQASSTLVSENVLKMWSRIPTRSMATAAWFINQDVLPQLPQLNIKVKNVAGSENVGGFAAPIYQFPSNGGPGTLMGAPVIPVEYCATLGTLGDVVLADLSQYQLIEKGGMQSASSMHVRFLNDEQVFRITWRLDGQPIWNSAVTPKNGSNTISPFVILEAR